MQRRNWALVWLVYIMFLEALSWAPAPRLAVCLVEEPHTSRAADYDQLKYCPPFHTGIEVLFERTDKFLEAHDKSVIGGFTIVLAISTIGLWLATNKLWAAGERQIAMAERSADAALLTAKAAIGLELLILQANVQHLLELNKSYEINDVFDGKQLSDIPGKYTGIKEIVLKNHGRTLAFPISLESGAICAAELTEEPNFGWEMEARPNAILRMDKDFIVPVRFVYNFTEEEISKMKAGEFFFWYFLRIHYRDFLGNAHEQGFCWKFERGRDGETYAFRRDGPESYHRKT